MVYQHEVSFDPQIKIRERRRRVLSDVQPQLSEAIATERAKAWAYDGDRILYTFGPVNRGAPLDLQPQPGRATPQTVHIRQVAQHDLSDLGLLRGATTPGDARPLMHILDVVLKQRNATFFKTVGQSVFDPDDGTQHRPLGRQPCDAEMWLGYRQSVVHTEKGPMLQVDLAASSMLAPMNVLQFIAMKLKAPDAKVLELSDQDVDVLRTRLNDKFVRTTYNGRRWRVRGISRTPASDTHFETSEGNRVSVVEYFLSQYKISLEMPHLPCLRVGVQNRLVDIPLELCEFVPGQPKHDLHGEQKNNFIRLACAPPEERVNGLLDIRSKVVQDAIPQAFGVHVDITAGTELMRVPARILQPLRLQYRDSYGLPCTVDVDHPRGHWQMRSRSADLKYANCAAPVHTWVVVSFVGTHLQRNDTDVFVKQFLTFSRQRGMHFEPPAEILEGNPTDGVEEYLQRTATRFAEHGMALEFVLCVLPDRGTSGYLYPAIKRWAHTTGGVPSQCVLVSKLVDRQRYGTQYISNLCLKINTKLGGHNVHPSPGGCALCAAAPTIVFGADVYHAPPGSDRPSFAAVVSSMDPLMATYYTTVSAQTCRVEIIESLEEMVAQHLRRFYELNGGLSPRRIIFYRDGVGNTQFPMVREREVAGIRRACQSVGGAFYNPALVFVIIQKRNHLRMFSQGGRQIENVIPGTVVDKDITSSTAFDFYLCSHYGLKGTSRPTHYHILHDDLKLSADELQRFTYDLCHLYARCTRIVSNPAPAYYAHLAATHAHFYMTDFVEDGVDPFEDARSTYQKDAPPRFCTLSPHMQDKLYFV